MAGRDVRIGIVGAGMSGLCMAATLRAAGIGNFRVLEKAGEVGGTWRENTYPGLSCDVPARFYSYSFAPNAGWTSRFASGAEIQRYFVRIADRLDLRRHISFGTEVVSARWTGDRWHVRTSDGGADTFDVLIAATGVLHHPRLPDIPGLDTFAGPAFHSARWDHSVPLDGRTIAVIGTGSTGVQITTALAERAGRLLVFQRTAQWIMPIPDWRYAPLSRAVLGRLPALNRLSYRFYQRVMEATFGHATVRPGPRRAVISGICRLHLRLGVRDPELRRRLEPPYQPMCKRLIMSAGYYRAMQRPTVELVTDRIDHVEPAGILAGGRRYEPDAIVLATGFDAHAFVRPMRLIGEDGHTLDESWRRGPRAYRTVAVPGFPNFFMLIGPHSPIGNHSLIAIAETQADYVLRWIGELRSGRLRHAAPTPAATEEFNAALREALPDTVWATGCTSWYLDADGRPELWPWSPARHRAMLRDPVAAHFARR
jgi:cation diffusion facilitator CzcD-associated flavoprotein CzcO